MRGKLVAILAILAIGSPDTARSQAIETAAMPPITLPASLKPYSNTGSVIGAADGIIRLLGTAEFSEAPTDSVLGKAPCNTADLGAFYRGMTMMQAGYFMFINKMERGFEAVDSPHVALAADHHFIPAPFGFLVRPGRELLISVWDRSNIQRLTSLTTGTRDLPAAARTDLSAYFSVLREFGQRHAALTRRAPRELEKVVERSTTLYRYEYWQELDRARLKGDDEVKRIEAERPKYVFYEDYSKAIRVILDDYRDLGMDVVSECLDGGAFAEVRFGAKGEIKYQPYGLYPTAYMIGFWQRRAGEGTTALTQFVIGRLLAELAKKE
jgi:peptidoglycan/xylan/chitin deacetylase (PgdA/CDA1 family)